jgi:FAD:protein FMN transferase
MFIKKSNSGSAINKTFFALGTINSIKIFDSRKEHILEEAVERVSEIEDRMSAFNPESDLSKLRANAGRGFQKMHRDTFRLIRKAVTFGALSSGMFDVTIRPLVELWGINKKGNFVPSDSEIQSALSLVNYQDIGLNERSLGVSLKKLGQSLDLGGIAKGFAADEVKRILLKNGIRSAMINLGGNIMAVGKRPDGQPWQIGVQNPLAPTGQYLGILSETNKTVVTSGSNERFFIKDGIRYHHILDPRTGRPAQSSVLSVTAVCACSEDADALTTALFILGPEKSEPLLRKVEAEAIFINKDLSVNVSQGLENNFKLNTMSQKVSLL